MTNYKNDGTATADLVMTDDHHFGRVATVVGVMENSQKPNFASHTSHALTIPHGTCINTNANTKNKDNLFYDTHHEVHYCILFKRSSQAHSRQQHQHLAHVDPPNKDTALPLFVSPESTLVTYTAGSSDLCLAL